MTYNHSAFNSQAILETYDWTLEDGGTAPPSQCTMNKARMHDRDRRRIKKVYIARDAADRIMTADSEYSSLCSFLAAEVLTHFGIYQEGYAGFDPDTQERMEKALKQSGPPFPSDLEEEILREGLVFVDFLGLSNVPDPIVNAIESYIKKHK